MRKLFIIAVLVFAGFGAKPARADVALGAFFGEPTGLDLKLGLAPRSSLDIVAGWYSHWPHDVDGGAYGHVTYLITLAVGHGRSVNVPFRLGIGGAIFDQSGRFNDDLNIAARFPLEVGLMFRHAPIEIYGELAIKMTVVDENDNHPFVDLDGGVGLRFYF